MTQKKTTLSQLWNNVSEITLNGSKLESWIKTLLQNRI